jgi:hypothetical protein
MTCEYARRKWIISGFSAGAVAPDLSGVRDDHAVAIQQCDGVQWDLSSVVPQCAALSVCESSNVGLVLGVVSGAVELVRCNGVQLQCDSNAVQVDGCRRVTLFVRPERCESTQVRSSSSSEVEISVPVDEFTDPRVYALPTQFVTAFRDGQWHTSAVKM